ncbi:dermonecrotic toxin domain-containing protein [Pseudomonas helmanticensis]|nr:DUF6543 domain-containing protein [Pseudomonas helmanticensis]
MTDKQGSVEGQRRIAAPASTAQALLLRLRRWKVMVDERLGSQMTLLEAMEHFALIELRVHYPQGNIVPGFVISLLDAVLQRLIDRQPVVFRAVQDSPYRWPGGKDPGLPSGRREVVIQTVEAVASYFLDQYKTYLREHWASTEQEASFDLMVKRKLQRFIDDIDKAFHRDSLAGLVPDRLRQKIERIQKRSFARYRLTRLANARERQILEALSFAQLAHWLRVLNESDRVLLHEYQDQTSQAQKSLDGLLEGYGTLRAYARQQAIDHIQLKLDMEVEPDIIQVRLMWRSAVGQPVQDRSLSELLAAGPISEDFASVLEVSSGSSLRNQPLEPAFIGHMLSQQDFPAQYLQALGQQYERADVKKALIDWFTLRLQQSAFVARCAGHITVDDHERLGQAWDSSNVSATSLRVAGLTLPNGMKCTELLVFYREETAGDVRDLLLYAPNKPDGQEWIRLTSLAALSEEVWEWTQTESGREYLLQQVSTVAARTAREYLFDVSARPSLWGMRSDIRRTAMGFMDCVEDASRLGLARTLDQVEQENSPRWYTALALEARRRISSLNQELVVHQKVFNDLLGRYEVFVDFAKRTVAQELAPYMRSKNVLEPVDPSTVLIDYRPNLTNDKVHVASLLELAIYGYDDNSGIDHPRQGVRSSVGQDLSQLRSADLALYLRTAYLGDKYAREIRGKFLDAGDAVFAMRRSAYRNVLLSKMDRDLRVARSTGQLDDKVYLALVRQVSLLSQARSPGPRVSVTSIAEREGMFRFTVRGNVVLGVYVFACFDPDASYWLYMPDAPDGMTFRPYQSLFGETAGKLSDYVMARVAVSARKTVSRLLRAMAAKNMNVDMVYESQRVSDARSEFNAYIERSVTDVEDVTTSRAEMIEKQVVKGLMFASAPFCLLFPPFALLLDIVFVAVSAKQAIEAHLEGDTDGALIHWLEASWGALFAMVGAASAIKLLGQAARSLKQATKSISLVADRLRNPPAVRVKQTLSMDEAVHFKPGQAVRKTPENLQLVSTEGTFFGTYHSPSSVGSESSYYIRRKGKYYQVKEHPTFYGLILIDPRLSSTRSARPIFLSAGGKWVHTRIGARGGEGVRYLGRADNLRSAFPGRAEPVVNRGAMQGEAVVARFSASSRDNYLFSLNAQTCVIASLYNPATKAGAVIHFDHNIRSLIDRTVKDVIGRLGGTAQDIRSTLVGGDWLTGADIGGSVRQVMKQQGLRPDWDYWSYSSCLGNNYGVTLNLSNGVTTVYKISRAQFERMYLPIWKRARDGTDNVSRRFNVFRERFRAKPLKESAAGTVVDDQNLVATPRMVEEQAFAMVLLS